jgi:hypothetical protein
MMRGLGYLVELVQDGLHYTGGLASLHICTISCFFRFVGCMPPRVFQLVFPVTEQMSIIDGEDAIC